MLAGDTYRAALTCWITAAVVAGVPAAYWAITAAPGSGHAIEIGRLGAGMALLEAAYLAAVGAVGFLVAAWLVGALGRPVMRPHLAGVLAGLGWGLLLPVIVDMTLVGYGMLMGHLGLMLAAGLLALLVHLIVMIGYRAISQSDG